MLDGDRALLFLGCAALLIAMVMLRLGPKTRAIFFAAVIAAAMVGGHSSVIERVATEIVAYAN